jgi:murein DD-endopeptidase MepM/ murein hydrolase activator NlpD
MVNGFAGASTLSHGVSMKDLQQWLVSRIAGLRLVVIVILCLYSSCATVLSYDQPEPIVITIVPGILAPGDVARITITPAAQVKSISCIWADQKIAFYHDGAQDALIALLGVDLEEKPGKKRFPATITEQNARVTTKELAVTLLPKTFPVQELSLPQSQVNLSPQDQERYERERETLDKMYARGVPERLWRAGFIKPLQGQVISPFGVRRVLNGEPRSPHAGLDLQAAVGTPVAASADGVVAFVGDLFFSGNSVFIDHGMGIFSMYFHLSTCTVQQGEQVIAGQTIGLVGATGRATGPHLHWGIRLNRQRVDPLLFVKTASE